MRRGGRPHEARRRPRPRRQPLRFPHHGRARQRPSQGRVRRQVRARARRHQGQMPLDVRRARPRRRSNLAGLGLPRRPRLSPHEADISRAGGKITRSKNYARGSYASNLWLFIRKESKMTENERFVSEKECIVLTGLSRSTLWRERCRGAFPRKYKISPGRKAYKVSELREWM